jgi:hypothetical protein
MIRPFIVHNDENVKGSQRLIHLSIFHWITESWLIPKGSINNFHHSTRVNCGLNCHDTHQNE